MSDQLTLSQQRARTRASRGRQLVELAKDDLGEALEAFSQIRGFSRHYARLARLHDEIRRVQKKIEAAAASDKTLDLSAQAKKEEAKKTQQLAARVRKQQDRQGLAKDGNGPTRASQQDRHARKKGAARG